MPLPHFSITHTLPRYPLHRYHTGNIAHYHRNSYHHHLSHSYELNGYPMTHPAAPGVTPFPSTLSLPSQMNGMNTFHGMEGGLPPFPKIEDIPGHGMESMNEMMNNPFDHNLYHQQSDYRSHSSPKSQIVS